MTLRSEPIIGTCLPHQLPFLGRGIVLLVCLDDRPLTKAEQKEARDLMRELKKAGVANGEISELSSGKWSPSTIKYYTPGIKPLHPNEWDSAVKLLNAMIASGLSLDHVETAVAISDQLQVAGVSLSQLVDLFFAANSSSMEAADLCHYYELMEQYSLSPKNISETVSLKDELENMGLSLDSLQPIIGIAKNYGEPEKIIQALSQYKKRVDLDHDIEVAKEKIDNLNKTLAGTQAQVEAAEVKLSQLKEPVEALDKVEQLGFGVNVFKKVAGLVQKYGSAKKLLDAISAYDTYADIQDKVNKEKASLTSLKTDTQKLQLKHAHIQTAINMCEKLTSEYGFGLDAVSAILSTAEKYGDPIIVLKAVEAYGKLEVILQEIDKQQGIISANKKEIAQLDGWHENVLKKLKSLNDLTLEVGNEVGRVEGEMAANNYLKKLLMLINEPYSAEYSDHINTATSVALSLRHWVMKNETKFVNCNHIKSGLEFLVRELGGLL